MIFPIEVWCGVSRLTPLFIEFFSWIFRAGAPRRQSCVGSAALGGGAVLVWSDVRAAASAECRALLSAAPVRGGAEPSGAAVSGLAPRAGPDKEEGRCRGSHVKRERGCDIVASYDTCELGACAPESHISTLAV